MVWQQYHRLRKIWKTEEDGQRIRKFKTVGISLTAFLITTQRAAFYGVIPYNHANGDVEKKTNFFEKMV